MKRITYLGLILILFSAFLPNTAVAQLTYTWTGGVSNNWADTGNWSKASGALYPGQGTGDVVLINNGGTPILSTTVTVSRVTINNTVAVPGGSKLTISTAGKLNVSSASISNVILNGGNIENNGELNITTINASGAANVPAGISCGTPSFAPTSATTFNYSGTGKLNINTSGYNTTSGAGAGIVVSALNALSTYKFLFVDAQTTFTLNTTVAQPAIRANGGALAASLIIGGSGFTLGTPGIPVRGGLIITGGQAKVTIESGTILTLNSAAGNVSTGVIVGNSATTNAATFVNKGTINILGDSNRSGLAFTTFIGTPTAAPCNLTNEGVIFVKLNCSTVASAPLAVGNGGSTSTTTVPVNFVNTGTLTFINTSTALGTGAPIFASTAGQAPPVELTNNGTLTLEGSSYNYGNKFAIRNNSVFNTNSELRNFTDVINNVGGSINLVRTSATATTKQVAFTVAAGSNVGIGTLYNDVAGNLYAVVSETFGAGSTTLVTNVLLSATTTPGPNTLTKTGAGAGEGTLAYSGFSASSANSALTSTTTNSGTINTDAASSLNIISGVTAVSTGVIAPGGSSGKGIADFSKSGTMTTASKFKLDISAGAVAGVDFDQISNSAANGGFNLSGATLEITSLYTPTSSVSIPIIIVSGLGTISGTFASVSGLAPNWTLEYSSTAVNLVYTVFVTPTIWTGAAADNNFFNEANWISEVNNAIPDAGTIDPGININLALQINMAATINIAGSIQFGTGSLALGTTNGAVNLSATALSGGTITVNEGGYIELSAATPFLNNVKINFTSGIGWIKTPDYKASALANNNLGQIKVNGGPAVYANNLRLDHYYLNGCVIRANLTTTTPLTVYDSSNLGGSSAAITVNTIHSNTTIANSMNNKIESFILKKGFMLTVAIENDGTGKSKNYIASETDLVINVLPQTLQNSISFIRVIPWNWVTKKGFNAPVDSNLDASWRYQWNPNDSTTLDWEFAPMTWGHTSANDPADITLLVDKYNSPYVMSFNEPDDCDGQSGQYGNLCQTDVAVGLHKNLMKTGMRIVSPGGKEEAPFGWLKAFYDKTTAQDIRIDVIAVHWYDWSAVLNSNPNDDTAALAFNRFKAYLTNVHNLYGLPIWITEFNANPARSQAVNAAFLELALPYLESLDYIERYCWFPFNTGTHFTTGWDEINRVPTNTIPSLVGTIYKNINNTTPVNSTPSIPESTVNADNSLDLSNNPNVALNKPATASSFFSTNVASNAVDGDTTSGTSRWLVEFSTRPLPAWIEVDLQGSFTIDSFRIFESSNAARNFRFEVWDATLNSGAGGWAVALNVTNNPNTPVTTYKTITPVATTKVRLFITGHNDAGYIRMFELEVYGLKNNPTWTGATSSAWTSAANWSTGIVPDQFSNVLIAGGATFQPTISANTTINSLMIATGATLTVTAPSLTIKGAIDNEGTMSLANNCNLFQGEEFYPNTGNISINKDSSALRLLDYTIWSSPVENQNLLAFSPATTIGRFYNYNQTTNLYNAVASPSTTAFGLGAGHLIRMPNTHPSTPTVWSGTFNGVPNNGTITRVVTYRNVAPFTFGFNMIGNPYPSTLNATTFIAENTAKIENILYFWRKTNGAGGSAYATWVNGVGGTASGAGSETPNGTIQVGQGFFVRAKPGTNPDATTYNQTLTFTNAMRLENTSTQFFKTKQVQKDRIWLNLTNTAGVFSQTLIGYIPEATYNIDAYDGAYINDSPIALTSNINNAEYTIQGRPAFDPTDVVALNFKTDVPGAYTIAIDNFEGVFATGQNVYLVDGKTGIETDLKATAYNFTAAAGIDNARFTLKYQKILKIDASAFNENSVRVYKNNGTLFVNSGKVAINNIKVFDIQGRLLVEQKNVKATTATIKDLKATNQVLIVKITGEDNSIVSKKVVH